MAESLEMETEMPSPLDPSADPAIQEMKVMEGMEMEMETEMETEMMASEAVATRTANRSVCNPQRPPHRTLRTAPSLQAAGGRCLGRPSATGVGLGRVATATQKKRWRGF